MSAVAQPTRLFVERRFPLAMTSHIGSIRELYEQAKAARWDPQRHIAWTALDASACSPEVRAAARSVWSRRAWLEYTGLAETPALIIRFCLETGREPDPKFFLTVRNTEEAWHVEVFHRLAEAFGGYLDRPADRAWEPVFDQTLYREALDADQSLDAYVATHCAVEDGLEADLFDAYRDNARDPVVRSVLDKVAADKRRHAEFGWLYLASRADALDAPAREAVAARIGTWIRTVAFAGYQVPSLATAIDTAGLAADAALCAGAGLGAVEAAQEQAIFRAYVGRARTRLGELGITLPGFEHPMLGAV